MRPDRSRVLGSHEAGRVADCAGCHRLALQAAERWHGRGAERLCGERRRTARLGLWGARLPTGGEVMIRRPGACSVPWGPRPNSTGTAVECRMVAVLVKPRDWRASGAIGYRLAHATY